jgi:hypothetical protein
MFDGLDEAGVVDAITAACREQNAACGRELVAIGELWVRFAPEDDDERENWAIDGHANVVAEIAAALNISRGRAARRLDYAISLRERLPEVAKAFVRGDFDFRMMALLVNRTDNVDDAVIAELDRQLAARAAKWMTMSGLKLEERIDMWITKYDPAGVREPRTPGDDRYVHIGPIAPGAAGIWAKLDLPDGIAIDDRLDAVAATVCENDPRTQSQRRSAAMTAVFAGQFWLVCQCGAQDCAAAGAQRHEALSKVVIEVIAAQTTLSGQSDNPGYVAGYGPVPAAQLRDWASTATLRPVAIPPACAEPQYRPSAALARFIRCRDLTCRAPGCDAPAAVCQIDHTIPYPMGPTHPSNLKLLCVFHHLHKTFWVGAGGWVDRQYPDGTVVWTSPSGKQYTTEPGGALLFPDLATPTGEFLLPTRGTAPSEQRGLMMPKRKTTRAQDKAYRIALERQHNAARIARKQLLLSERLTRDDQPPPF